MLGSRRRGTAAILVPTLVAATVLGACSGDDREVEPSSSEAVTFESADGVRLEGRLFGEGTSAVVLSHMRPADQSSWYAFADRLADAGYLVLTYNFRGYCPGGDAGCSDGEQDVGQMWRDVLGAVDFVTERGATSVSLVGASMGGTASLVAAAQGDDDVRAVVTLSAPASIDGMVADASILSAITAGKLYIAGVGDAPAARDAEILWAQSPPPKGGLQIVPSDDHGTDLLTGGRGEAVARLIETYLEQTGGP
jgi:pimeloyl-ACP methyl ester carboxylesterase